IVFPATSEYAFAYYARTDAQLRRRLGASWPRLAWNVPFDLSTANRTVLATASHIHSPTVWVAARDPGGSTVRPRSAGKPILSALPPEPSSASSPPAAIKPYQKGSLLLLRFSHLRTR